MIEALSEMLSPAFMIGFGAGAIVGAVVYLIRGLVSLFINITTGRRD